MMTNPPASQTRISRLARAGLVLFIVQLIMAGCQSNPTPSPTDIPPPTNTPDPNVDWTEFVDPWGRYSVRYPPDWHLFPAVLDTTGYATTIYPTKPGVVTEAAYGWNDGYGNLVQVRHHDGTISIYAHLRGIFVKKDQPVGRSTELGESGNSGSVSPPPSPGCTSCGDHLHFEVRNPDQSAGANVQYLVDWNEGCPGCSDQIKGTAGGDPRQLFLLDSFLYYSSEKTATSTLVLDAGRTFLLTVTGTFSFWSPSQWGDWLGNNADRMCWGIAEEGPLIPSPGDRTGSVGAILNTTMPFPFTRESVWMGQPILLNLSRVPPFN